jgi:hypothetical protein
MPDGQRMNYTSKQWVIDERDANNKSYIPTM